MSNRNNFDFVLTDWANNIITDRKGYPLEFRSVEEGWDYITETYNEEDFDEFLVTPKEA